LGKDYFKYDEAHHVLRAERSGQTFRLGQRVRVKIVRADPDALKVDLQLVEGKLDAQSRSAAEPRTESDDPKARNPKRRAAKTAKKE
jgi:ribonuclease R